ncbi:Pre-mRNA-splicing factor SLU7 [Nakaseomyces bracarensis]|uniref:Pre-mRNA-splicing factor SLU7 n=1 Tax=Nakaseomyces bracarensis TaxID=273131 RepID=A0ABR4NX31_9SACH
MSSNKKKVENEHIPLYIKSQPWYYKEQEESEDYLKHHRQHQKDNTLNINDNEEPEVGHGINDNFEVVEEDWKTPKTCDICDLPGHATADCLEGGSKRHGSLDGGAKLKRRKDAKNWDARNDRWYGYEGKEYNEILKRWQEKESDRKAVDEDDDRKYDTDEEIELFKLGLSRKDLQQNIKGSSIRLREDKAAYLHDIRSETINYDPKSRLYKSEDLGTMDEHSKMFLRHVTGEGKDMTELNKFARENAKKLGIRDELQDVEKINHVLVANPTKLEQLKNNEEAMKQEAIKELKKQQQKKKLKLKKMAKKNAKKIKGTPQSEETKKSLMDLYG